MDLTPGNSKDQEPSEGNAVAAEAVALLADLVVKCTEYGSQDGGFVAHYLLPTGPVHRAIPYLEGLGIIVRPGFDGRQGRCPGCDWPLTQPGECDRCEYFNLASGRYHYCGERSCYCRNLPGRHLMKPEVLGGFAEQFRQSATREQQQATEADSIPPLLAADLTTDPAARGQQPREDGTPDV